MHDMICDGSGTGVGEPEVEAGWYGEEEHGDGEEEEEDGEEEDGDGEEEEGDGEDMEVRDETWRPPVAMWRPRRSGRLGRRAQKASGGRPRRTSA